MTKDEFMAWVAELYDRYYLPPWEADPLRGVFETLGHGDGQRCEGCDTFDRLTLQQTWELSRVCQQHQALFAQLQRVCRKMEPYLAALAQQNVDDALLVELEIFRAQLDRLRQREGGPDET